MRLLFPSLRFVALLALLSTGSAQTLTVFAAASLTDAFGEIGERFEAGRSGVRLQFGFAGSSTLATQLLQGARADLFASADARQLERVAAEGLLADDPVLFAGNSLVLLVPADSPLASPADLATPGLLLVLAAAEVPAGRYARDWLAQSAAEFGSGYAEAVLANVVSNEPNVRQAAAKVVLGEADAALVYRSDSRGLQGVRSLELPGAEALAIGYPIAVTESARHPRLAAEFIAFVLSDVGQEILARHGFSPPPSR